MTAPAAGIAPTLVVFAKEPTPGRVKTRLADGDRRAARRRPLP